MVENDRIYDITEVCKLLGTTSRTLRFYEERGIISSMADRSASRRRYTEEQLSHIRNVIALRALGLPVKTISDLISERSDLKEAVLSRRAEICASIHSLHREIDLLDDTLIALDQGEDIFSKERGSAPDIDNEEKELARICTDAIVSGDTDTLYRYFSPRMAEYTPRSVFEKARTDTFLPLGSFIALGGIEADPDYPQRIFSFAEFSKIGLKITLVLHGGEIDGLWLGYYKVIK